MSHFDLEVGYSLAVHGLEFDIPKMFSKGSMFLGRFVQDNLNLGTQVTLTSF